MPTTDVSPTNIASHRRHASRTFRIGFGWRTAAVTAVTALFLGAGAIPALAAPGDISNSEGQFLSGSLLDLDLAAVAALAGESATSDGTADQTNANNLDLTALGLINLTAPGGIQIPLDLANAGVISQYASALADAASVGASGAVASDGTIGVGPVAPGVAPGPLTLSLGGVVGSLGLPAGTLSELANLGLTVDAVSGRASQAAPAGPVGSYQIDGATLDFDSATVAGLVGSINDTVAALQPTVDGLADALETSLDVSLLGLGIATTDLAVSAPDLAATIAPLTTGTLTNGGVTIDLDTGAVSVDLDAFLALNGQLPNTEILTPAVIGAISANILAQLTTLTTAIEATLQTAVDGITVVGSTTLLGLPIVTIDTTAGALLAGDTTGIAVLGLGLGTPLADIVAGLVGPLTDLTGLIDTVSDTVLDPVINSLLPALEPVISAALSLTVNNQSNVDNVFTETALRVTVLPDSQALTLDLGRASVGPNVVDTVAAATSLTPDNGPETGNTAVTITGTGFLGTTDVTVDGASVAFAVVDDTSITFTTVAHAPGATDVVVTDTLGSSAPLTFTFTPVTVVSSIAPTTGPEAGGTTVTITGACFTGATAVFFGGTAATSFTVVNDTTITAVAPPGTGTLDVTVVGAGTCGTGSLPDAFTYLPAAVITSLAPVSGPTTGGTTVVITGTGFTGTTDVTFDGASAATVLVDSDTQITVTTPAHAAGPTDVVVLSVNGDSGPGLFTFFEPPVATSLSPDNGPETGGTPVIIVGSGFTGATDVTIDGVSVPFVIVDDGAITFTTPAHTPATVPVVVTGPGGVSAPLDFEFIDVADAVIVTIVPDQGPVTGGTTVVITGTGFIDATDVTFDGLSGAGFSVDSDTQITVTTPAHAAGPTDVIVLAPNGDSAPGVFTFVPAAVLTSITPTEGPEAGGTVVTLTGTGFTDATDVTFDGISATDVTVDSDTQITATSPAHAPGLVDVIVLSPGDDSAPADFTYLELPVATSLTPDNGPEAGGTDVTITGTGFTDVTLVTIDGASVPFVIDSDTEITFTTPAHLPATVPVVVTAPGGSSDPLDFEFTDVPDPVISSLAPVSGPVAGGTTVIITGTGFTGATAVTFSGTFATTFAVNSATQITVTTPPHAAGATSVVILSPNGNSAPGVFTFVPLTVTTSLTPSSGPETGGTGVAITGSGFTAAQTVTIDGVSVPFVIVSDTSITFTTPAHVPATVPVVVAGPGGASAPLPFIFTDIADAAITGLVPTQGPVVGGTTVVITGTGFTVATGVTFDGLAGTGFVVNSATQITVVTPAHAAGATNVIVLSPTGNSLPGVFTYVAVPVTTSLTPNEGPETGGTPVTIAGSALTGATSVTVDGDSVPFVVVSDSVITFTTPVHVPATVPVVVTTVGGSSAPLDFEFTPVTTVDEIDPATGPEAGGNTVTITGSCFTGATSVLFGLTPATSFVVVNDTTITAVVPAGTGVVDVTVTGGGTCGTGDLPDGYTYLPAAVVTSVVPDRGPETGGTTVVITGTGFTDATDVTFDGDSAAAVTVDSDTQITAVSPAHVPGLVDLVVLSPGGDSTPVDFTFLVVPVADSLTPSSGPETGGTVVTIDGSGFTGTTAVTVDGVSVPFIVVSDTTITFVTPVHVPATVPVVVTGPGGSSDPLAFEFTPATTVDTIDPGFGPEDGGTPVTITGSCFTGATAVLFGAVPATSFVVVNDTTITAVAPAGTGIVDVTVVGDAVCGTGELPDGFEYVFGPLAIGLSPDHGGDEGGDLVTITGIGFLSATSVTFGGVEAPTFTVVSDTEIQVIDPPHDSEAVPVVVSGPSAAPASFRTDAAAPATTTLASFASFAGATGAGSFSLGGFAFAVPAAPMFTYDDPMISGISPDSGPTAGGTSVSISGVGFDSTFLVSVDGVAVDFVEVSDTLITFTSPEHAAGTVSVMVDGESEADQIDYRYVAPGLAGTGFTGLLAAGLGVLVLLLGILVMTTLRRRKLLLLP